MGRFLRTEKDKWSKQKKCGCKIPGWEVPIDDFNLNLRRYRLGTNHKCRYCPLWPRGMLEDTLHVMSSTLVAQEAAAVAREYYRLRNKYQGCKHDIQKLLKTNTGLWKSGGKFISPNWRNYCYWETMFGYMPPKKQEELQPEVEEWLGIPRHLGGGVGTERYISDMYNKTRKFLRAEWSQPKQLITLQQYLSKGFWVRGKSGTGQVPTLQIQGKRKRGRRFKGYDAVIKDDPELMKEMLSPTPEIMKVMQKSEGVKIRPVVKTGNEVFRKMDFLSELIENGLKGSKSSTLFTTNEGAEEIDIQLVNQMIQKFLSKVPLDQGGFDQHQSQATIAAVLLALWDECIRDREIPGDYELVMQALWDSLFQARWENGSFSGTWKNGIPSGWRWTALLDTLLNISSFLCACDYILEFWNVEPDVVFQCMQGDDVIFSTRSYKMIPALVSMYAELGYDVHPQKTYISRDRGEFLRRSYEPNLVTGYFGRSALSIMYRNPTQGMQISKLERLTSRVQQWALVFMRGASPHGVADRMIEDAEQMGVTKQDLINFCFTPSTYGGIGMTKDDGGIAAGLLKHLKPQGWVVPQVEKEPLSIGHDLGAWNARLDRLNIKLTNSSKAKFREILARTWGLEEKDLVGKVTEKLVAVTPNHKLQPGASERILPRGGEVWDMEFIPTTIKPILKAQVLEDKSYLKWVKDEYTEVVVKQRRRMSGGAFRTWLLDLWTVPLPMMPGVALKYGAGIKRWAESMMLRFFASNGVSLQTLERRMLWLEEKIRGKLKFQYGKYILGQ